MEVDTPQEVMERHPFNTSDGTSQYGSITAPTFKGQLTNVEYCYEFRMWHHASFGSDSMSLMTIPVTMACPESNLHIPVLPPRRNSGNIGQTQNFLNDMVQPGQNPNLGPQH